MKRSSNLWSCLAGPDPRGKMDGGAAMKSDEAVTLEARSSHTRVAPMTPVKIRSAGRPAGGAKAGGARSRWLPLAAAGLCALMLRGAEADDQRPLSHGLPAGAVVMLETEDLRGLLERWRDSGLRQAFKRSAADKEFARSKLALRLLDRLEKLEQSAGAPIGLDALLRGVGRRAAFGLYDIGETAFVLTTELPELAKAQGVKGLPGLAAGEAMEPREHRGLRYLIVPEEGTGLKRRPPLCVASLGSRLLVGNDLLRFQDALVLSARELGVKMSAPAEGARRAEPQPADQDAVHKALQPALRLAARDDLRIYVTKGALQGNRYFDRYWIFGPESAAGINGALLSLSVTPEGTTETRAYSYAEGAAPKLAPLEGEGRADVVRLTGALPPAPYAQVTLTDAAGAAALVTELLPVPQTTSAGSSQAEGFGAETQRALTEALTAAGPLRALELADPKAAGLLSQHRGALALSLRQPAALEAEAFERALLRGIEGLLGVGHGGPALRFEEDGGARVLRLPLLAGWALSWQKQGDHLLLATGPEGLATLRQATGAALREGGPLLRRVELDRSGSYYQGVLRVLKQRENWSDRSNLELYQKVVGGLPEVVKPVRRVLSARYRLAGVATPLIMEEVRYLP